MPNRYHYGKRPGFYLFTVLLLALVLCFSFAVRSRGYKTQRYETVTVKYGDTLWDIAGRFNKKGDIRRSVFEIKKLNNLKTSRIYPGVKLKVPVEE